MKKKLLALVCALALVFSFAGCTISTPDTVGSIGDFEITSGMYLLAQYDAYQKAADLASSDEAEDMGVAALGVVDLQAHILQFVAELAYLYLRCVLFEYDDHSVLSPLPYRVKRRGRPAPLPQLAVSNFSTLKCVTL